MKDLVDTLLKNPASQFVLVLFLILFAWWLGLHFLLEKASSEALQLWAAVYQSIAFYAAIAGLIISARWGGLRSVIGRAIIAFSLGLLFQCFGQSSYSYYIYYLHIEVPYQALSAQ